MVRVPGMKALNSRLLGARAAEPWLDGAMLRRMPEPAVYEIDGKLGRPQPDDALMYLRLNVTRWRVDDFVSLGWEDIMKLDLSSGRLPLLFRERDGSYVGCDTGITKGDAGHVILWRDDTVRSLSPSSWEAFFEGLVSKLEQGAVAQDPLRILGGLDGA